MSKYTTELRFYCEEMAGYHESQDYNKINEIVEKASPKIFENFPIYDEEYRLPLECKILRHFYTREICAETPGLWKLFLNNRLNEIMPYYNQLYKSAMLDFNPLYDVDITKEHGGEGTRHSNYSSEGQTTGKGSIDTKQNSEGTVNVTGSASSSQNRTDESTVDLDSSQSINGDVTHHYDRWDKYSNTPQGQIDVDLDSYLTDARNLSDIETTETTEKGKTDSITTTNSNGNTTGEESNQQDTTSTDKMSNVQDSESSQNTNESGSQQINSTDKYVEYIRGKQGSSSYSYMLEEYRRTLLNIDMMIINELNDLFMMIY